MLQDVELEEAKDMPAGAYETRLHTEVNTQAVGNPDLKLAFGWG